jgi:hypothetical protein
MVTERSSEVEKFLFKVYETRLSILLLLPGLYVTLELLKSPFVPNVLSIE